MTVARSDNGGEAVQPDAEQAKIAEDPARVASIAAGGLLTVAGLSRGGILGLASAALGGNLVYGGIKGTSPLIKLIKGDGATSREAVVPHGQGVKQEHAVTIDKPRSELYQYWHDFRNMASFMEHVESVTMVDSVKSHWVMRLPNRLVEWDAELYNDVENEIIAWRSLPGAPIANAGTVRFKDAAAGRGTEVRLILNWKAPAGPLIATLAKMLPDDPAGMLAYNTLRRFKQLMETGEIATSKMRRDMMASQAVGSSPMSSEMRRSA